MPGNTPALMTGGQTLTRIEPGTGIDQYDVGLRPGVSSSDHVRKLNDTGTGLAGRLSRPPG